MSTSWEKVYQTSYQDLVQYLHRKVKDRDRAQDLAQEAFVRLLNHRPAEPRPWLFKVAANLVRDEQRGAQRRKRHLALLSDELPTAVGPPEVEEALETASRRRAVERALETLGERDREVLLLWDAGLSYADIAANTGLAVGAIGTTLARARRRLAAALQTMDGHHVAYR